MTSKPFQSYTCTITSFSETVSWGEVSTTDVAVYSSIPCQYYASKKNIYKLLFYDHKKKQNFGKSNPNQFYFPQLILSTRIFNPA